MEKQLSFQTKRLLLKDIKETDLQQISEYACDSNVFRHMLGAPHTIDETKNFIARAIAHQSDDHAWIISLP